MSTGSTFSSRQLRNWSANGTPDCSNGLNDIATSACSALTTSYPRLEHRYGPRPGDSDADRAAELRSRRRVPLAGGEVSHLGASATYAPGGGRPRGREA